MNQIRIEEYKSLHSEIDSNKRNIFERPLVIVTEAGIALATLNSLGYYFAVYVVVAVVTYLNLQFSYHRFFSLTRIVAYLRLFHESNIIEWIGWENSVSRYREYQATFFNILTLLVYLLGSFFTFLFQLFAPSVHQLSSQDNLKFLLFYPMDYRLR